MVIHLNPGAQKFLPKGSDRVIDPGMGTKEPQTEYDFTNDQKELEDSKERLVKQVASLGDQVSSAERSLRETRQSIDFAEVEFKMRTAKQRADLSQKKEALKSEKADWERKHAGDERLFKEDMAKKKAALSSERAAWERKHAEDKRLIEEERCSWFVKKTYEDEYFDLWKRDLEHREKAVTEKEEQTQATVVDLDHVIAHKRELAKSKEKLSRFARTFTMRLEAFAVVTGQSQHEIIELVKIVESSL